MLQELPVCCWIMMTLILRSPPAHWTIKDSSGMQIADEGFQTLNPFVGTLTGSPAELTVTPTFTNLQIIDCEQSAVFFLVLNK